jgi:hypothetical protein
MIFQALFLAELYKRSTKGDGDSIREVIMVIMMCFNTIYRAIA